MKNGEVVGEEYVGHNVAWVAVAVRCHTVVRGVHLAARLREEVCSLAKRSLSLLIQVYTSE